MKHIAHRIVVGGTRGIGKCFARFSAERGIRVSILGRREVTGEEIGHPSICTFTCDITDAEATEKILDSGVIVDGSWTSLVFFQRYRGQGDAMQGEWAVSVEATARLIESFTQRASFFPGLQRSIVIVGSLASQMDCAEQPMGYHAGKAAQEQLVRNYAVRLGPRNIRVNMVTPAIVLKDESAEYYLGHEALQEMYKTVVPLQRMGTALEIAQVVDFLCSDAASYITGQNVIVDGGLSVQMQEGLARKILNSVKGDNYV